MKKIKTVFIANRGEIACRLIRAAHAVGAKAVVAYSDADRHSAHVDFADDARRVGPAAPSESYLNIPALIRAAQDAKADAVAPGCGFLSESPPFAEACEKAGLVFVGPAAKTMALAASKSAAREVAQRCGVPVLPGFSGKNADDRELAKAASRLGFPVFVKALAGGGGRGMRLAKSAKEFPQALAQARGEARTAFGDGAVFLERFISNARHLEAQILADNFGNTAVLGERDCSWQRRNQKMVEESPAPNLPDDIREQLLRHARALAEAVNYRGAGTAEFLLDADDGRLFFLEINARLQVEHPVTEMTFGEDLAAWQLRIAAGERVAEDKFSRSGWAMEARVCAEDPLNDFMPATGVVSRCEWPGGVRTDAGIRAGDLIGGRYDSLVAKIIAHGKDREDARIKLTQALAETRLTGVASNLPLLRELACAPEFVAGKTTVGLFAEVRERLLEKIRERRSRLERAAVAAVFTEAQRNFPAAGFRLNQSPQMQATFGGRRWEVVPQGAESFSASASGSSDSRIVASDLREARSDFDSRVVVVSGAMDGESFSAEVAKVGGALSVWMNGDAADFRPDESESRPQSEPAADGGAVARAPTHAFVRAVSAEVGDIVSAGDSLMTLEAMKMEIALPAPRAGRVVKILAAVGDAVAEGAALAEVGEVKPERSRRSRKKDSQSGRPS